MSALAQKTPEDILVFEPFVRTRIPALICLEGFSGCGKTKSGVLIVKGMQKILGGKALFLDTETGRGKMYAKDAEGSDFIYAELTPPFTPERYMSAIKQAERSGFDHLIIDSGSHEWDGLGGMLEIADSRVDKFGKPIQGKAKWSVKSRHKAFINTMMAGRMNIVICLRAKDRFVKKIVDNKEVEIIDGFVPLQERNFKYDMMIQLPMPEGGKGRYFMDETVGFKCPGEILPAFEEGKQINESLGEAIGHWVKAGISPDDLLRSMKNDAFAEAEQGVKHFREYWKGLAEDHQAKLKPFVANFESVAKNADAERADLEVVTGSDGFSNNGGNSLLRNAIHAMTPEAIGGLQDVINGINGNKRPMPESDWWGPIDEIEGQLTAAKSMKESVVVIENHSKIIANLMMSAPMPIKNYWSNVLNDIEKKFAAKAA